jgi:Zn-dependent M16 (insulinase) family peptidase
MTRSPRAVTLMLVTLCASATVAQTGSVTLSGLRPGVPVHGFHVESRYVNASGQPIGARFVHERTGFTLDYVAMQTAPQAFIWVRTYPVSDRGEPHTQEHLLLLKGSRGRALADLEMMALGVSSAFVQGWRTAYHFHTPAGPDVFYRLLDTYLDALLSPDYTDEEIRREVRNFGVTADADGTLRLEEKGTVYNEMVSSFERPGTLPARALVQALYGDNHPLAWSAGGFPAAIREMEPAHIRRFHADHYQLGNMGMVGVYPSEMSLEQVLVRTDAMLLRHQGDRPAGRVFMDESRLPAPRMAPPGEIRVVDYPHQNPQQPSLLMLGWPAERRLDSREQLLLDLFLDTVAGDPTTNLYRIFIDREQREIETGAQAVSASASRDMGHPVVMRLLDASPALLTETRVREVRERILAELRGIAAYGDGSPELLEFNARLRSRLVETRRASANFLDQPPGFGQRNTGSAWISLLHRLSEEPGFDKSLALAPELKFADGLLAGGRNVWREYLLKWQLLDASPYVVVARPSPELIERERRERRERADAEVRRLAATYGTASEQATIRRYQADYDAESVRLDAAAAAGTRPPFIDAPPMVLDPQLTYDVAEMAGVPVVVSTFPGMSGATAGLALRLDVVPQPDLLYLALLPQLLTDVGVIRDGRPMPVQEMRTALRHEILELRAYISGSVRTGRSELVLRGSGTDTRESSAAVGWMQDVLTSPDWRPENLPRIRDVVDQALGDLRRTMQRAEEQWVNDPANAYRRQDDPLFLATQSVLTRTYHAYRLRWQLQALPPGADGAALLAFLRTLEPAGAEAQRPELLALLRAIGGEAPTQAAVAPPLRRYAAAFEALSPGARAMASEAARDFELTLADVPDGSLAADWRHLAAQMARDLEMPPARALDALHRVRRLVLNTGSARLFTIGSPEGHAALRPALQSLAGVLSREAVPRVAYARDRVVDARLAARTASAQAPLFVGLVNPNTQGGVFLHSAPLVTFEDTGREALLDYLASRLYGGGGSHSLFSKTVAAGLAYSNGLGGSPISGRITYYAERVPELPQTLRFVIGELRRAERDDSLVDYAIAQAFLGSRSGTRYEERGEAMAADLADGQTPEQVRRFREAILALRREPDLLGQLFTRLERVTGRVFPGYGPPSVSVPDGVYFVIGPEPQLQLYEEYLRSAEDGAQLHRLYPRDFWLERP